MKTSSVLVMASMVIAASVIFYAYIQMYGTVKNQQVALAGNIELIDISKFVSLKAGSPAPDFSLQSISGRTISLKGENAAGKAVVIQTMAPGCSSCAASLKPLGSVYGKHSEQVAFIAFNVGAPDDEYLREYVKEQGFVGEFVTPDESTLKGYGILSTDILYIIAKDGNVKEVTVPPRTADGWEKLLTEAV